MKKLFLVFLILLVVIAGLSAAPPREGGGDNTLQMIIPRVDITVSIAVPVMSATMRSEWVFVTANSNKVAFAQAIDLICFWSDQYRNGLLAEDDFKTLVAGRIIVLYMMEQIPIDRTGGMRIRATETRKKIDSQFKVSLVPD